MRPPHAHAGEDALALPVVVTPELIDAIASRVADMLNRPEPEAWIGADEAARHIGCPRSRIYRLVSQSRSRERSNPIPFVKDGQGLRFRRSDLDAWLERGGPR